MARLGGAAGFLRNEMAEARWVFFLLSDDEGSLAPVMLKLHVALAQRESQRSLERCRRPNQGRRVQVTDTIGRTRQQLDCCAPRRLVSEHEPSTYQSHCSECVGGCWSLLFVVVGLPTFGDWFWKAN